MVTSIVPSSDEEPDVAYDVAVWRTVCEEIAKGKILALGILLIHYNHKCKT